MKDQVKKIALIMAVILLVSGCGTGNEGQNSENNSQTQMQSTENLNTEEVVNNTEVETETEEIVEVETTLYAQEAVNVRSMPSTDSEKLGTLGMNAEVIALGEAVDGWQKIRYNDSIAYISAEYLGTEKVAVQTPEPGTNYQPDEITAEDVPLPSDFDPNGIVVVIDPGHQGKGNYNKEPDGPGSSTLKAKVASGTAGVSTGIPEYQLTLTVSLQLRDELRARGYQVVMIRETHESWPAYLLQ